jgi:ribonucleoside-triphosphate reductase
MKGLVHIHDLGYPRVYCSSHSLEYIKKYGLDLDNLGTSSAPAKYARVLTGHLNTYLASMQAYYAGALGLGFLNIFYAPFLEGMSYDDVKQEAQYLIFSGSQNAFSRGGQSLFLDANIHLGIPDYLKGVQPIGPKGKYIEGKTYGDFEKESQMFARALMEVWKEGDREGHPFAFPKMDLHINNETFTDPKQYELFKFACEVASENGSPYFFFDRGDGATLSQCCRLRTKVTDPEMLKHPESIRFCGFQNVTINLPQCAYRAGKENLEKMFEEVNGAMDIAMKAHLQKKQFIKGLMVPGGALYQIGKDAADGKPYVDLEKSTYIIGLIGLNEAVQYLTGQQLHESEDRKSVG